VTVTVPRDRGPRAAVTGARTFAADLVPDALHLVFVRSPVAHARFRVADVAAAAARPGVVAVWRAEDLPLVPIWEIHLIPEVFAQPPLATGVVRYAGERVAAVVADSLAAALDAAEAVVVEYDPEPAVTDPADPAAAVALRWSEPAGSAAGGDPERDADDGDEVVVRARFEVPRVAVSPLEGHAVVAVPEADGRLTVLVSTQVPHGAQIQIARSLALPLDAVRVVVPAVGGGFGGKSAGGMPDHVVTAAAAHRLGRPVRFVEDRAANLVSMQGRGVRFDAEARARRNGALIRLRVDDLCDAGAYPTTGAVEPGKTHLISCGPYRVRAVAFEARSVTTNRAPTGAYRGPGRSEAAMVLERTLDALARELGVDPVAVRRANLLGPAELPRVTPTGAHLDEGDYPHVLDVLLRVSRYDELRAEQRRRRAAGATRVLGLGLATVVDSSAWFHRVESATVRLEPDGRVTVVAATVSAGQDQAAAYARLAAAPLGIDPTAVTVVEGDTDVVAPGGGSVGSRSVQLAGSAVLRAAEEVAAGVRRTAAALLEAAEEDVVLADGRAGVRGVPARTLALAAVARHAASDGAGAPTARCTFEQDDATYTFTAHLAVVEVDVETGAVTPQHHHAVTDCGRVVDPPGAAGQVVGACAQGIAQALLEELVHDGGTPRNASLAEYGVPSAAEVPPITATFVATPTSRNPLGAKGVGECGMVAAPAATYNAVVDALAHLGVREVALPCTPHHVWTAIRQARAAAPVDAAAGPMPSTGGSR
jgi:carbon-monoxide dehydrogenase large subunit